MTRPGEMDDLDPVDDKSFRLENPQDVLNPDTLGHGYPQGAGLVRLVSEVEFASDEEPLRLLARAETSVVVTSNP